MAIQSTNIKHPSRSLDPWSVEKMHNVCIYVSNFYSIDVPPLQDSKNRLSRAARESCYGVLSLERERREHAVSAFDPTDFDVFSKTFIKLG